jgi:transcriptional regulator with XRE-family HTH domain
MPMTQEEIAERLGISQQAVSKWYKGKGLPNPVHLVALSKLLNIDVETLLKEFLKLREHNRR